MITAMFTAPPWLPNALAIALAVVAAVCFASAAFLQQGSVARDVTGQGGPGAAGAGHVGLAALRRLARQPRWLGGWVLIGGGTLLHVSALLLAPIGVVQPVGILAVPIGVALAARAARAHPSAPVLAGVALAVAGTASFVILASTGTASTPEPVTTKGLGAALLVVAVVAGALLLAAQRFSGPLRCVAYASVGAVGYGFGSSMIRVMARAVAGRTDVVALVLLGGVGMICAISMGAWAVQQAYAAGPAPVVTSGLTVGDPVVAILLSAGLLGEAVHHGPGTLAIMIGCAAVAAAGVALLATHQPSGDAPSDRPPRAVPPTSADGTPPARPGITGPASSP